MNNLWNRICRNPKSFNNWIFISRHPYITCEMIELKPDFPWVWFDGVTENPNITMNFVIKHIDKNWDWKLIFRSRLLTIELIEACLEEPYEEHILYGYIHKYWFQYNQYFFL